MGPKVENDSNIFESALFTNWCGESKLQSRSSDVQFKFQDGRPVRRKELSLQQFNGPEDQYVFNNFTYQVPRGRHSRLYCGQHTYYSRGNEFPRLFASLINSEENVYLESLLFTIFRLQLEDPSLTKLYEFLYGYWRENALEQKYAGPHLEIDPSLYQLDAPAELSKLCPKLASQILAVSRNSPESASKFASVLLEVFLEVDKVPELDTPSYVWTSVYLELAARHYGPNIAVYRPDADKRGFDVNWAASHRRKWSCPKICPRCPPGHPDLGEIMFLGYLRPNSLLGYEFRDRLVAYDEYGDRKQVQLGQEMAQVPPIVSALYPRVVNNITVLCLLRPPLVMDFNVYCLQDHPGGMGNSIAPFVTCNQFEINDKFKQKRPQYENGTFWECDMLYEMLVPNPYQIVPISGVFVAINRGADDWEEMTRRCEAGRRVLSDLGGSEDWVFFSKLIDTDLLLNPAIKNAIDPERHLFIKQGDTCDMVLKQFVLARHHHRMDVPLLVQEQAMPSCSADVSKSVTKGVKNLPKDLAYRHIFPRRGDCFGYPGDECLVLLGNQTTCTFTCAVSGHYYELSKTNNCVALLRARKVKPLLPYLDYYRQQMAVGNHSQSPQIMKQLVRTQVRTRRVYIAINMERNELDRLQRLYPIGFVSLVPGHGSFFRNYKLAAFAKQYVVRGEVIDTLLLRDGTRVAFISSLVNQDNFCFLLHHSENNLGSSFIVVVTSLIKTPCGNRATVWYRGDDLYQNNSKILIELNTPPGGITTRELWGNPDFKNYAKVLPTSAGDGGAVTQWNVALSLGVVCFLAYYWIKHCVLKKKLIYIK